METKEEIVLKFLQGIIKGTEWENTMFLAGGAVRDEIMGKKSKDLDFVVNKEGQGGIQFSIWLGNKLGNFKEGSNPVIFERFGTSKLSLQGNNSNLPDIDLEFVSPRKEVYSNNSRKPEVSGGELIDDVLRRDLTINSLLKNVSTGEILDLTGRGVKDIKAGIIRTTSEPDSIFKDDALRILRCLRFSTKFGFEIEKETFDSLCRTSKEITNISKERVTDEFCKILLTDNPKKGLNLLYKTNVLQNIIPELIPMIGMGQNQYHNEDVFEHTLTVTQSTPKILEVRLMALFHDIGKTVTKTVDIDGVVHFYGHEHVGVGITEEVMKRMKFSNEIIKTVTKGVGYHMMLKHGGDDALKLSDKSLRKFIHNVGEDLSNILELIHSDNISHSDHGVMLNQIPIIKDRIKELVMTTKKITNLPINGNDLIKLGFKPSKIFKEILNEIEDMWFENPNVDYNDCMKIVNKYM